MNIKSTDSLVFWTFAAVASFGMLYLNNHDLIDKTILPEIRRAAGIPSTDIKPIVILEKTKPVPAHQAGAFRPLPDSVTPTYVESEKDRQLREKLGFDVKDPGYCTSDPCTTN